MSANTIRPHAQTEGWGLLGHQVVIVFHADSRESGSAVHRERLCLVVCLPGGADPSHPGSAEAPEQH